MASPSQERSYRGALDRGLAIVELLAESADGLPLSAMPEDPLIRRTATHRLLTYAVKVFPGSFGTFVA